MKGLARQTSTVSSTCIRAQQSDFWTIRALAVSQCRSVAVVTVAVNIGTVSAQRPNDFVLTVCHLEKAAARTQLSLSDPGAGP